MPWRASAVEHLLEQLVRARVDERVGHLDLGLGDGGVERRPRSNSRSTARSSASRSRVAMSSRSSAERVEAGRLGGELVVELGQPLGLDLLDGDGEAGRLPASVLAPVVLGERDLDGALSPAPAPDELLLEAGDQAARAELEQLVAALAALERLAVDRADVVDHHVVAARPRGARPSRAWRSARAAARAPRRPARRRPAARGGRPRGPCTRRAWRSGRTPISIEKAQRLRPRPGRSPTSRSGSPTGAIPASSIASTYQLPSELRSASSSTASRPSRRMTTGGGTLPLRKPGIAQLAAELARGLLDAALDLLGGHLGLDADARLGQLGDGGLDGHRRER